MRNQVSIRSRQAEQRGIRQKALRPQAMMKTEDESRKVRSKTPEYYTCEGTQNKAAGRKHVEKHNIMSSKQMKMISRNAKHTEQTG